MIYVDPFALAGGSFFRDKAVKKSPAGITVGENEKS